MRHLGPVLVLAASLGRAVAGEGGRDGVVLEWMDPAAASPAWAPLDPAALRAAATSAQTPMRRSVQRSLRPDAGPAPAPPPADPCAVVRVRRADGTVLTSFRSPAAVEAPGPATVSALGACVAAEPRAVLSALGAADAAPRGAKDEWSLLRLAPYLARAAAPPHGALPGLDAAARLPAPPAADAPANPPAPPDMDAPARPPAPPESATPLEP